MKNIAILGFGKQGLSAYEYWNKDGNKLTICDAKADIELPSGVTTQIGEYYLADLDKFDLIIRSPALHPQQIIDANPNSPNILEKVTTVTNEFFKVCPTKNIIGVTGTKGKGTTCTLITKMLEATGHRVHLGGNIGIPPLEMLKNDIKSEDWVVLELANFQLIDLKHSPTLGVCLMVEPEHQDWHKSIDEYVEAKQQLFRWQTDKDKVIYFAWNSNTETVVSISPAQKIPYFNPPGAYIEANHVVIDGITICSVSDIRLLGEHNRQNVCAAVTATWQITQDAAAIKQAIQEFSGLPFRTELRREVNDVKFYNDSFASAPDAAIAAIECIPHPKVMIVGGHDRGLDLTALARAIQAHKSDIRKLILIGAAAERIKEALEPEGFENYIIETSKDMSHIVGLASKEAQPGDAVVLSPGFPSFDMFKNFEDRGLQYNEAVDAL